MHMILCAETGHSAHLLQGGLCSEKLNIRCSKETQIAVHGWSDRERMRLLTEIGQSRWPASLRMKLSETWLLSESRVTGLLEIYLQ